MSTTLTPNMNLIVPGVGTEAGPDYATDINASLSIIDQHDHTNGSGVPITPSAMDINSDLTFQNNLATNVGGVNLTPLLVTPAINTIYESGVDLYFVDGSGNNVRITQSGGIAGSPGSISNLTSPASASYVSGSQTFVWQSGSSIAANMDAGSVLMRNLTPNSTFALTLQPPAALAANYTLTLPTLPASKKMVTLSTGGVLAADYDVDNATLEVSGSNLRVKGNGIGIGQLANQSVTQDKMYPLIYYGNPIPTDGIGISNTCGIFTGGGTGEVQITSFNQTITTTGRPVRIELQSDGQGTSFQSYLQVLNPSAGAQTTFYIKRNGSYISTVVLAHNSANELLRVPPSAICFLDYVVAGTYTYSIHAAGAAAADQYVVRYCVMVTYQI
jgi:hypothetical protein